MRATRLSHAIETGALTLPQQGRILLIRPRAGDDLGPLLAAAPSLHPQVVTGFAPDAEAFAAAGLEVVQTPTAGAEAALVCIPRARALAEALLAMADRAVVPGGLIIVDGQKTDGIEPIQRALAARGVTLTESVAKAHGRLFTFRAGAGLQEWESTARPIAAGPTAAFVTRPGVFSADGPDPASVLLADTLPETLPPRLADLGAGWGFLAAAALRHPEVSEITLIEAEADALDCARANLGHDARARFVWADALRHRPAQRFDAILCNPPFHTGREADPGLGIAFIRAAAGMLSPAGALWLVANRHLPYDGPLGASFREVAEVAATPAYRVWRAARPQARGR